MFYSESALIFFRCVWHNVKLNVLILINAVWSTSHNSSIKTKSSIHRWLALLKHWTLMKSSNLKWPMAQIFFISIKHPWAILSNIPLIQFNVYRGMQRFLGCCSLLCLSQLDTSNLIHSVVHLSLTWSQRYSIWCLTFKKEDMIRELERRGLSDTLDKEDRITKDKVSEMLKKEMKGN